MMIILPGAVQRQIGQRIRVMRVAESWTQDELAQRAGLGVDTIRRAERTGAITLSNLLRIAATFGALETFTDVLRPPAPTSLDEVVRPPRIRVRRRQSGHGPPGSALHGRKLS